MTAKPIVTTTQVANYLEDCIHGGEWPVETRLPSERVVSERLKTTRVTVREALKRLESKGLIYRSNRRGWFIAPARINYDPTRTAHFMEYAREQGHEPYTEELQRVLIQADEIQAAALEVEVGTALVQLYRRRGINNRPIYLEHILLRADLFPDIQSQSLNQSLTQLWHNHYQQQFSRVDVDVRIASLDPEQSEQLHAPAGYSCFHICRRSYNQHGDIIEYDLEYWRHDALNIQVSARF